MSGERKCSFFFFEGNRSSGDGVGPVSQRIRARGLVENDSDLVHGLLEVEGALVGSSRT